LEREKLPIADCQLPIAAAVKANRKSEIGNEEIPMGRQIVIDPVTRIEGHGKITIQLDDKGQVSDAQFHVTQIRGFEKFCEGRPFHEMPAIVARICGICPVSHLLASAKACDALLAVKIPETAAKLRRMLNYAQYTQSHALSFFHLSSPDMLLGMDSDPAKRNVFGVIQQHPDLAKDGIRLRQIGQQIIEILAGKRIHPAWAVPGGVNQALTRERRDKIAALAPEAKTIAQRTIDWYKGVFENFRSEIRTFGNFPSLFMGLVSKHDADEHNALIEHYDGVLRVVDASGNIVVDNIDPARYAEYIGEATVPWSYLKMPYFKPQGYPDGMYRVGPLARVDIIDRCGTAAADREWTEFRALRRGAVLSSFHNHYARLIEILYSVERIEQLINDPDILNPHVRAFAGPNNYEGVGVIEAPRGTLIHHYKINSEGLITGANMIVATGHNNLAMNRSVLQVAKHFVKSAKLSEGMLNRVEAVIRAYDPCLSCSTHALGQMPLDVEMRNASGEVVDRIVRD
jgi:NAD-reducing hydrogenase large subunit